MKEEKILINGLEINYKIIGEGRPFLIFHGWNSNSNRWLAVAEILAKKGLQIIIPDLPGFGKSSTPPLDWDPEEYLNFAKQFIDRLNLENFYLLGHSFGGSVAIKYSIDFPDKVQKLFLISAACFRKRTPGKFVLYIFSKFCHIFSFLPFYENIRKGFYKYIVRRSDYPYSKGAMKKIYLKIIKRDLSDILPAVATPTVIIWGEKDKITPLNEGVEINRKIKNSKIQIIEGVNHSPNLIVPEKLAQTIGKFL